ncbi:hypothetical protein B9T65_00160 [Serratia marcescens]|nr:hypothetical protein AR325_23910 [Serratia marcescens]PHI54225.1 hypothetical protein B9T65_00160 [Serratia marcescens]
MIFGLTEVVDSYRGMWSKLSRQADYLGAILRAGHMTAIHKAFTHMDYGEGGFSAYKAMLAVSPDQWEEEGQDFISKYCDQIRSVEGSLYDDMCNLHNGCFHSFKNLPMAREYFKFLALHDRYSFAYTFSDYGEDLFKPREEEFWVRRALSKFFSRGSKAGLEKIISSGKGDRVHFVLDGIDIERVINKSGGPSITNSELRYLYRHRHDINGKGKVHFYKSKQEVLAPWESDPARWREYTPASER